MRRRKMVRYDQIESQGRLARSTQFKRRPSGILLSIALTAAAFLNSGESLKDPLTWTRSPAATMSLRTLRNMPLAKALPLLASSMCFLMA